MRWILAVFLAVALAGACLAADMTLVKPMPGGQDVVVLYLPQVGKTCELVMPVERLYQWPAVSLDAPSVTQGRPMAQVGERLDPIPAPEGDFDMAGCKAELVWGGRGIKLTFTVPDKMTTLSTVAHSPVWNNTHALRGGVYYGAKDRLSPVSVEVYPMQPWTEFVAAVGEQSVP